MAFSSSAPNFRPNRRLQLQKRRQLFIGSHASARPLQDQTHRELVYRRFQFNKRSQLFFGSDDETLSVARIALESFLVAG